MKITKSINKKILLWGDSGMTMNAKGEIVLSMEIRTIYYLWKIRIWQTIKYEFGTEEELLSQPKHALY